MNRFATTVTLALFFCTQLFAANNNRITNELLLMLQPSESIEYVTNNSSLRVKECLSAHMNIWWLESNTAINEQELNRWKNDPHIKIAQYNHTGIEQRVVPNDFGFVNQWALMNTGQAGGTVGADIQATDAWDMNMDYVTANGDTVVVAIVESRWDLTHEDINYFKNYHEIPNNDIDDDANGYIDDYDGWNVYDTTGDVSGSSTHTMHVSGIACARSAGDSVGIAGVCPGAQVMCVAASSTNEARVVAGYSYITEMRRLYNTTFGSSGAFVVSTNASFGDDFADPADYPIWCAMYDSLGAQGVLSAAATVNSHSDIDLLGDVPTACASDYLIAVTNTTRYDKKANAGYGLTTIDMGAPGSSIYSCYPGNAYQYLNGTSMASPHLAGTVGAMFAAACPKLINDYEMYPDSIALIVEHMIYNSREIIPDLFHKTVTGGRLNLYRAIKNLEEYNCNDCNFGLAMNITQPICKGDSNGALVVVPDAAGIYSYIWNTGDTTSSIANLPAEFYSVTVTDSTGCQRVKNGSIDNPDSIIISNINTVGLDSGVLSGTISITASAGNEALTYSLDGVNFQSTPLFTITSNGSYTVYVKNEYGCIAQQTVMVSDLRNALPAVQSFSLFPNPSRDAVTLAVSVSKTSTLRVSICNLLGEEVWGTQQNFASGFSQTTLNVASLPSGLYLLKLSDGNNYTTRKLAVTN